MKQGIKLDPEDVKDTEVKAASTTGTFNRVSIIFNSQMADSFEDSNFEDLKESMFSHIKTHVENSKMPESRFLAQILHLNIEFNY